MRIYLGKKLTETTSPWFKNYIQKAKDLGILPAQANVKDFNGTITRNDLGIYIYRVSKLKK